MGGSTQETPRRHPGAPKETYRTTQGHQREHPGGTPGAPRRHPTRKTRKCPGPPKPLEAKISIKRERMMPTVFDSLQNWVFEKHPEGTQETPQEHPGETPPDTPPEMPESDPGPPRPLEVKISFKRERIYNSVLRK